MVAQWGCDCVMAILPAIASPKHGALVPISFINLGGVSQVTFSNIPQAYQDLMIVLNIRSTQSATLDALDIWLNGVTGSGLYSSTYLRGDGSSASSNRYSSVNIGYAQNNYPAASSTSGIFGTQVIHLLNYTNTTTYKTALIRSTADLNGSGQTQVSVDLYRSTSAVTSFSLGSDNGANFASGSTAELFGVRTVNQ